MANHKSALKRNRQNIRKREALENVLIPLTAEGNRALIAGAGFRAVELFFRWNNFAGFVALK